VLRSGSAFFIRADRDLRRIVVSADTLIKPRFLPGPGSRREATAVPVMTGRHDAMMTNTARLTHGRMHA